MSKYDRDAIEIYILDHIDTDNYVDILPPLK